MKLFVSPSPHVTDNISVQKIMLDVIIALLFPLAGGTALLGIRALTVTAVSVLAAVASEYIWCRVTHSKNSTRDLSAVVTGILLALCCPVNIPLWMVAVGSVFAIIIVKQCFGGIGKNFMNPALCARAFMLASFPAFMTDWQISSGLNSKIDAITSATPLTESTYSISDLFFGRIPGCIGELSALLILVGALYLLIKRVITLRIPVSFLATFAVFVWIMGENPLYHLLSGGLMLGAFFMATDYTTSPVSKTGHIVFGVGCGIITGLIRIFGSYPEGVTYAILVMNALVPFIDKVTLPKKFGAEVRR